MKTRTTLVLVVLAVVALAAGWFLGIAPTEQTGTTRVAAGAPVFPDIAGKLNQAAQVEITHQGQTIDIADKDGVWGLAGKGGYPVQPDKLRAFFAGLTQLRLMEPRTSDPAEYDRLGVADPSATSTSTLVRVLDTSGQPLAALIVGHRRVRTQGEVPESVYVRRPGEEQSWLAEGALPVDADPQLWLVRDIANISATSIAGATVTRIDSKGEAPPLVFKRDGDKLVLSAPADHPKLDDYKLEDVGRAYDNLTLTDVKPAAQEPGEKIGTSVFTTTDGEAITATVFKVGSGDKAEIWAQFAAAAPSGDNAAAKAAAEALQKRVAGWTFQLGAWKEKALVPSLDDLKSDEPATPAAAPAPPALPPAAPATPAPATTSVPPPAAAAGSTPPTSAPAASAMPAPTK
jgi:hypothetical protein